MAKAEQVSKAALSLAMSLFKRSPLLAVLGLISRVLYRLYLTTVLLHDDLSSS